MNIMKNIILFSLSALLFASGCSTTNGIRVDESITAEQKKAAVALAKEFGIENTERIYIPFDMRMDRKLTVRGDEQLKGGIGRYKELTIFFEERTYDFDPPRKIIPTLHDCSMCIVEFVELEIESGKRRVFTENVNPKLALKLLTKIYNLDFTLAPDVDTKECLSKVLIHSPAILERSAGWNDIYYELTLNVCHVIRFAVEEDNLVIQKYEYNRVIF